MLCRKTMVSNSGPRWELLDIPLPSLFQRHLTDFRSDFKMHTFVLYAILAVLTIAIYQFSTWFAREIHFKSLAKTHGCEPPRTIYRSLAQTLNRLYRLKNLIPSGEDFFDDLLAPDFGGKHTFYEYSILDITGKFNLYGSFTTIEPKNIQAMLSTQFNDFEVGDFRYQIFKHLIGRSIFTSDGAFWEHSRAIMRPQFARENVNDLDFTDQATDRFIKRFGAVDAEGWTSEVTTLDFLVDFTLASGTHFSFAHAVDLQDDEEEMDEDKRAFTEDLEHVSMVLVQRARLGFLKWIPGLIIGEGPDFRKAHHNLHRAADKFINEAVHERGSSVDEKSRRHSLVKGLAEQIDDPVEMRNQSMAVLMAGRDASAGMLAFCFNRLALHPEIFQKLRAIVLEHFSGTPTASELKACKYLTYFMNEIMRLHPNLPFNNRLAVKDTTLPVGGGPDELSPIAIRKGTVVNFSVYFLHRRKDLWGEDADEFKPERWETPKPQWWFLPFLAGPRHCPGQEFARIEAAFVLVRICQRFEAIEPVNQEEMAKLRKSFGLVVSPIESKVRLKQAT